MKKEKMLLAACLILAVSIGTVGCASNELINSVTNDENNQAKLSAAESSAEYDRLSLITNWEDKGTYDFSSNSDSVYKITEGGAYTIEGSTDCGAIVVDTDEDVKLILNGVDITNPTGPVIYGNNSNSIYVELAANTINKLADGSNYETDSTSGETIGKGVISSNDDLVILGDGSLEITANYKHGIVSDDKIYVEAGNVSIVSKGTDGIHANDLVCIDGGNIEIDAKSDLIQAEDILVINGGTISGTSADEGIESKNALYMNGGLVDISVKDDGFNATTYIEINGGDTKITTTAGDAIDSNGSIVINGGNVVAYGGGVPEGGLDCDNASVVINGGYIVATGDVNSPISEDSAQVTILYGSFEKGTTISIVSSDGTTIFEFTPEVSSSNMVISIPELTVGESYKVLANGETSQEFSVDSQVIEAGGSSTTMGGGMGGHGDFMGGQKPEMFDGQQGERPEMSDEQQGERPQMPEMTDEQRQEMEEMFKDGQRPDMNRQNKNQGKSGTSN